ncbi:MAG TPA: amidohydrolase [Terrimicrobiaceae bacterium]|nr:amidohydrolase [Terrimicrobiaceae bacterium]
MKIPVIDTHQHLWDPARFSYSWMEPYPSIRQRAMVEEYRTAAADLDIVQTVYVDTDVDEGDLGSELRAICALADDPANRIAGIVAGARMEREDPFAHFGELAGHPAIKGVRRVLHTQPDDLSRSPAFVANVRSLAERSWSFDLCVLARQLPLALRLVEECPDVAFVLDHCGGPDIAAGERSAWSRGLRDLAQCPHVTCKVSGLVTCAGPEKVSADVLRPWFDEVVACFGWDRMMWGGDWPVCTLAAPLSKWMDLSAALTADATPEQKARFFHGNARRIYRLEAAGPQ